MRKVILVFLVLIMASGANAAESKSKAAEKIIYALKKLDINDPAIKDAVLFADKRINNGIFTIDEASVLGLDTKLEYNLHSVDIENIQLKFKAPYHPNYELVAAPSGAMLRYSTSF